jgi:transposase
MTTRYVGIDAHTSSCTIAVMGETGKRLRELKVETERQALVEAVRGIAGERYICFEEGTLSDWMYELLEPLGRDVEVIQPPKRTRGSKNDSNDAWMLAEAIRVQSKDVVRVYKEPRRFTALRKAARAYSVIQRDLVRVKNRVNACYRARGLSGLGDHIYDPDKRQACAKQLPGAHRAMLERFYVELDGLMDAHEQAQQWLLEQAKEQPIVQLLSTAPGIGTIRASMIVAVILSPHRFRTRRQLWSYCGLAIVTRTSAEWVKSKDEWRRARLPQTRGLNRNRNGLLKEVFKGAALTVTSRSMSTHPLHEAYQRLLANNTRPNLARLTIARRIAAAVLAMWKKMEKYDPAKQVTLT